MEEQLGFSFSSFTTTTRSTTTRPTMGSADEVSGHTVAALPQERARTQQSVRPLTLTVWTLGLKPCLFFLERSMHFENCLAVLALIVVKRHGSLLTGSTIGEHCKVEAQQSTDLIIDLV